VDRARVVNGRLDAGCAERRAEGIAVFGLDHVEVVDVAAARSLEWRADVRTRECLVVARGDCPPPLRPRVEMRQLRRQERRLQRVEARVPAVQNVLEPFTLAVVAEQPRLLRYPRVVRHDGTTVAESHRDSSSGRS